MLFWINQSDYTSFLFSYLMQQSVPALHRIVEDMVMSVAVMIHHVVLVERRELNALLQPSPTVIIVLEFKSTMTTAQLVRYDSTKNYFLLCVEICYME